MADMNKNITFKAKMDTSALDQQLNQIKRKISEMTRNDQYMEKAKTLFGGEASPQSQQAQRVFQRERQADIRALTKEYDKMEKAAEKIEKRMASITEQMSKQTGEQKQQTQEMLDRLSKERAHLERGKIEAKQGLENLGGGVGGGPPGGAGQGGQGGGMGMMTGLLRSIGIAAIVKGAVDGITTAVSDVVTRDRRITSATGSAAQIGSRDLRQQFQGTGGRGAFFAQERAEAMEMAAREQRGMSTVDMLKLGGAGVLGAVGAGLTATGFGAAPGVAMMAGAGGLAAGIGGAAIGSERLRSKMFDPERYNALMTEQGLQNYESNLAAIKAQNPVKQMAREAYESKVPGIFEFQKSMGLSDVNTFGEFRTPSQLEQAIGKDAALAKAGLGKDLGKSVRQGRGAVYTPGEQMVLPGEGPLSKKFRTDMSGGIFDAMMDQGPDDLVQISPERKARQGKSILQEGLDEGFSQERLMEMANAIVSGGGTTAGARQGMTGAARLERQFGLDNAGQVMGMLSGAGMQGGQTEDAVRRILGEAVQMGVDESKLAEMPQEMQRFTTAVAEMATSAGGFSQGAVDIIQAGAADFTQKGLQGARAAAEQFRQKGKQAGGLEGQIGYGILGDQARKMKLDLSSEDLTYLNQLSTTEMREGDYQALAKDMGIEEEQLRTLIKEKDIGKQTRFKKTDTALKDAAGVLKGIDPKQRAEVLRKIQAGETFGEGEVGADFAAQMQNVQRQLVSSGAGSASDPNALRAQALRDIRLRVPGMEGAGDAIEGGDTGRGIGEGREREQAVGDKATLDAVKQYGNELKSSAQALTTGAVQYQQQLDLFIKAAKTGAEGMEEVQEMMKAVADELAKQKQELTTGGI